MSLQGKFTPLCINVIAGLIKNEGFWINPLVIAGVGTSNSPSHYVKGGVSAPNQTITNKPITLFDINSSVKSQNVGVELYSIYPQMTIPPTSTGLVLIFGTGVTPNGPQVRTATSATTIDLSQRTTLAFYVNRGTESDWGQTPDSDPNEQLVLEYSISGVIWTQLLVVPVTLRKNTWLLQSVSVPIGAKTSVFLRFRQSTNGSAARRDTWAITSIETSGGQTIIDGGSSVTNLISDVIRKAWTKLSGNVSQSVYNNLISIGSASMPALGNSPPDTFTISYNPFLYDSWLTLGEQKIYRFNHSAPTNNEMTPSTGRSPYTVKVDGVAQSSSAYTVSNNILTFTNPLPKGSKVELFTDEGSSYGFLRIIALQASKELYFYKGTNPHFVSSFSQADSMIKQLNHTINSVTNSSKFLDGTYSNMNDLITGDVTGVSLATLAFGQDLIKLGRAIDLFRLEDLGSPHALLLTLQENNSITESLNIALVSAGLTTDEILELTQKNSDATIEQEKKIYEAYKLISDEDLKEILIPLNTQTENLTTLADLLDISKLFLISRNTLTTPIYNTSTQKVNSKIYQFIFSGNGTNGALLNKDYGTDLKNILPEHIAVACDAFKRSMLQIKNINTMKIEKFAQAVVNMETISDIPGINGTTTPNDPAYISPIISTIAKGSGTNGNYLFNDFFGAMSGIPYNLTRINALVLELQTPTLRQIYTDMLTELNIARSNDSVLTTLIARANTEITNIKNSKPDLALELNTLWKQVGSQLVIEINSRNSFITVNDSVNQLDLYSFVENLDNYADDTGYGMAAATLEKISDLTIGGKSIIAAMREARNAKRLGLAGGVLDNDIPDEIPAISSGNLGTPIGASNLSTPKVTGAALEPGSFAGSTETSLIPSNLDIFNISSNILVQVNTIDAATKEVIDCNCDCWDDIENL